MSVPIRPTDPESTNFYDGEHIGVWRNSARKAKERLLRNPADPEAIMALRDAQEILQQHAGRTGRRMDAANAREMYSAAEFADANQSGAGQSFAGNVLDAASLGLGDEIAGLGAMYPGGMTPQQARDRYRVGRGQLFEEHPIASIAGQVTGAVGLGGAAARALPFLATPIVAGGRLGGSAARGIGAAAAIGGGEGVIRGLSGEGTIAERVSDAGTQGVVGAATAGAGAGVVNRLRLRGARVRAKDATTANDLELSNIRLARERAMTPARVQSAQNAATLSSARVEQIPNTATRANAAVEAIPDNVEYRQLRNELMRFRAERVRTLRAAPIGQRDTSPEATETALRGWLSRQPAYDTPEKVERAVEAARRVPGSRLGRTAAPSPIPVSTAPVAAPAPLPEATPSGAVEIPPFIQGTPGFGVTVEPDMFSHSAREAARTAYNLTEAAGGDAVEAARRAAGFASEAVPIPPSGPVIEGLELSVGPVGQILRGEPTLEAQQALMQAIQGLPKSQVDAITATLPARWRLALGIR